MFWNKKTIETPIDLERIEREKLSHTFSTAIDSQISCNPNLRGILSSISYIILYMKDYGIENYPLQPSEKYSIVLSESKNSYLIQEN